MADARSVANRLRVGEEAIVLAFVLLAAAAPVWEVAEGWSDEHEAQRGVSVIAAA